MKTIKEGQLNIAYVWSGFKEHFGKPKVKPKKFEPKFITLSKDMLDKEILEEYKPEEINLNEFAYLLESKEGLLIDGYANIFYIKDKESVLWAVHADWCADFGGWLVSASSVESPDRWDAGRRVVSRNLILSPSDTLPLDLEFRVKSLEENMEKIKKFLILE